jgi:indole-3-glycerol phosphate synthase
VTILDEIVAHKRREIVERKARTPQETLLRGLPGAPAVRDFRAALASTQLPAPTVIAEVKRRSPSKGALRPDLDPVDMARIYEQNGAAAISVLTDGKYFSGSLEDLRAVRQAVRVPVLCKEFVIDPYQVIEARGAGADAILLIAGILSAIELRDLRQLAAGLGMDSLVEVHDRIQLDVAIAAGAGIIGINNRNLHTFAVSLEVTRELLPLVPNGVLIVSESGIKSPDDRAFMAALGVDALLVGESLLTAPNVAVATRLICGAAEHALESSLP